MALCFETDLEFIGWGVGNLGEAGANQMMIFRESRCAWHARISAGRRMSRWICSVGRIEKD